ncbi:uncharacterized protein HMPREF1541_09610 [Cyphellophora europaea CBS 101466]|uniref:Uncharacterized protein n=1 Tax=Cyphellophora europaea (strain CBS 101466) TaxID=1220924 RepID=W2SAQ0_CYPE1|nr:uncharacterized protein HMPREF1541_09610 [Cyphellophora europaea CBS 101466]ETN45777.1 hypothetical protein HMPREF1541_09610 [Cyphellophora europaea CBS 101466]
MKPLYLKPSKNGDPLSWAFRRVKRAVLLPMLRSEFVFRQNGQYRNAAKKLQDLLTLLIRQQITGPYGASVYEILQVNLINETSRYRAIQHQCDETLQRIKIREDVAMVAKALMLLRAEENRLTTMYEKLRYQYFELVLNDYENQWTRAIVVSHHSAPERLSRWFHGMQGTGMGALVNVPRYLQNQG